jgi:hypothetical protein
MGIWTVFFFFLKKKKINVFFFSLLYVAETDDILFCCKLWDWDFVEKKYDFKPNYIK